MGIGKVKYDILKMFRYKRLSPNQEKFIIKSLEEIKEDDLFFYNYVMGKFHVNFGDFEEAISYLEEAVNLDYTKSAPYYNLYKAYVAKGDVKKAYEYLCKCNEWTPELLNFKFPFNLMCAINDMDIDFNIYKKEDYSVEATNNEGFNVIDDDELAELHKDAIEAFNNRDYISCGNYLKNMAVRINEINYPMEVETLIKLTNILKEKEGRKYLNLLYHNELNNVSTSEFCDIIMKVYSLGFLDEKAILRIVDEQTHVNMNRAKAILKSISSVPAFADYQDMIGYLRGVIVEKGSFFALPKEKREQYLLDKRKAKSLYKKRKDEDALKAYNDLKETSGLVICDYYIGKSLFRLGRFDQARAAFLSYLEQGGEKTEKAYMFLSRIEKIKKNPSLSKKYVRKMYNIQNMFNRDFNFIPNKSRDVNYDGREDWDSVKVSSSRKIHMTEEDFWPDTDLSVESFYDVDLNGKLSIIKNLLRAGKVEVADALFSEVKKECDDKDKAKVIQFGSNRKFFTKQKSN